MSLLLHIVAGGLLAKAAEKLQDESILLLIRDADMVSIEVRYHRSCYKEYTNRVLLQEVNKKSYDKCDSLFGETFVKFCEDVVEQRLIHNREFMRLTTLRALFMAYANDDSDVRTFYLKQKLMSIYPQIKFLKPSTRCKSEIVLMEGNEGALADKFQSVSEDESSDDETDTEVCATAVKNTVDVDHVGTRTAYLSALNIRRLLSDIRGCKDIWPPTAADFQQSAVEGMIPPALYNMLAWIVGASDEVCHEGFVATPEACHLKLLSIAQDIIYLSSKGRISTPKHMALGMTLRHWTGSSTVIDLLNGLGHSVSHSAVLEHDTALATMQLNKHDILPAGWCNRLKAYEILYWAIFILPFFPSVAVMKLF